MATLTDSQVLDLQTELVALKKARLSFLTGERANRMNVGDEGVGFADVKLADINMRIREIEDQLAAADPCNTGRRRPFRVQW
jgi:hypothetical protein